MKVDGKLCYLWRAVDHEESGAAFHVQSGSVDVGSASFSDYLRSSALLDADRYPSIDFVLTSVQRVSDHSVRVSGVSRRCSA